MAERSGPALLPRVPRDGRICPLFGDEPTTLAVVNAFYRDLPGTLLALVVDERKLRAEVRWEAADPAPPPGVAPGTLFPHVFGTIDRAAVERTLRVVRDQDGRATRLTPLT